MKGTIKIALFSSALAVLALPAVAQSTTPSTEPTGQSIQQRKERQQARIAEGVKNGQLTAGEAVSLEKKEGALNKEERNMRRQDGGTLTQADRDKLNQQQNALSNQIHEDRHNSEVRTAPKTELGQRELKQQERIAQGVKSGQLTAGEAAHLERNEARINNEVKNERAANGGKLTAQQRARANRQLDRQSRQIYRDKHNGRHQ
ncbi:MAG TPA: hypothetical protein VFA67_14615 [Candidatus Sulfotelmatobacter sp.]|nr:hypothetical protein [Candidatus Sulfotelmatobacter sp.]